MLQLQHILVDHPECLSCLFLSFLLFTFLFPRNHFHMGVREEEVEVDWDVCSQILKKCFLLTEIQQSQTWLIKHQSFSFFSVTWCCLNTQTEHFLQPYLM